MGLFDYPDTVVPEKSLQEITFLADLSEVDWARIKACGDSSFPDR